MRFTHLPLSTSNRILDFFHPRFAFHFAPEIHNLSLPAQNPNPQTLDYLLCYENDRFMSSFDHKFPTGEVWIATIAFHRDIGRRIFESEYVPDLQHTGNRRGAADQDVVELKQKHDT